MADHTIPHTAPGSLQWGVGVAGAPVLVLWLLRRNPVAAGAIVTALGGVLLLQGVHQSAGVGGADVWFVLVGLALALPGVAVILASRTR